MTSITLPSATDDWIDQTPFVCAHQIAEQYALQKQEVHTEKLYRDGFASLASSVATYPIQQGVPFLRPEDQFANLARPDIRRDFYTQHYQKRSRTIDLRSGYLADAQKFVAEFVTERHITGIVLDVGCGTGIFADCSTQYLGMDYSSTSVFAEGFETFRRFVGDAQCIPLADSSVELIISYNTLEHVPNPAQAFWEINRILKPGGYVILHPAWNCSILQTRLIQVRPYCQLRFVDKLLKAMQPIIKSRVFKACTRIPRRMIRRVLVGKRKCVPLRFQKLDPYLGSDFFIPDCDATASIDVHDAILFFSSRNYQCLSHPKSWEQVLTGHKALIARKPNA